MAPEKQKTFKMYYANNPKFYFNSELKEKDVIACSDSAIFYLSRTGKKLNERIQTMYGKWFHSKQEAFEYIKAKIKYEITRAEEKLTKAKERMQIIEQKEKEFHDGTIKKISDLIEGTPEQSQIQSILELTIKDLSNDVLTRKQFLIRAALQVKGLRFISESEFYRFIILRCVKHYEGETEKYFVNGVPFLEIKNLTINKKVGDTITSVTTIQHKFL